MRHFTKYGWVIVLLTLLATIPAKANWEFAQDIDPMTDDKTGFVSVDNDESTYGLAMKCWSDKDNTRWIAFMTTVDFDKAQKYPESTQISLRIDQDAVTEMKFGQVNIGNKLGYVTGPDFGDNYFVIEKKFLNAKNKIAVGFMANLTVFNVSNGREIMRKMAGVCPYLRR